MKSILLNNVTLGGVCSDILISDDKIAAIGESGSFVFPQDAEVVECSGKTAVLVERIKQLILKDRCPIDRMLIVTFTNAAASATV